MLFAKIKVIKISIKHQIKSMKYTLYLKKKEFTYFKKIIDQLAN